MVKNIQKQLDGLEDQIAEEVAQKLSEIKDQTTFEAIVREARYKFLLNELDRQEKVWEDLGVLNSHLMRKDGSYGKNRESFKIAFRMMNEKPLPPADDIPFIMVLPTASLFWSIIVENIIKDTDIDPELPIRMERRVALDNPKTPGKNALLNRPYLIFGIDKLSCQMTTQIDPLLKKVYGVFRGSAQEYKYLNLNELICLLAYAGAGIFDFQISFMETIVPLHAHADNKYNFWGKPKHLFVLARETSFQSERRNYWRTIGKLYNRHHYVLAPKFSGRIYLP